MYGLRVDVRIRLWGKLGWGESWDEVKVFGTWEKYEFSGAIGQTAVCFVFPTKRYFEILTSSTSECDLIWKYSL